MLPTSVFGVEREVVGVIGDQRPHLFLGEDRAPAPPALPRERRDRIPPSESLLTPPETRGDRFSRNAAIPSRPSAVLAARAPAIASNASGPPSMAALASWTATGAFAAISSPSARQRSRKRFGWNDLVDQSPALGRGRVNAGAGEDHLLGAGPADEVPQAAGPGPSRQGPDLRLRHGEAGRLGRDADVARQSQLEAAAKRVPVDRGNGRLAQAGQPLQDAVPLAHPGPPHVEGFELRPGVDVRADAESAVAGPGDDDGAYFRIAVDLLPGDVPSSASSSGPMAFSFAGRSRVIVARCLFAAEHYPAVRRRRRHPPSRLPSPRASRRAGAPPRGTAPRGSTSG